MERNSSITIADEGRLGYVVLKVTPLLVSLTKQRFQEPVFSRKFQRSRYSDVRIGLGDMVNIAIFEAAPGGLFNASTETSVRSSTSVSLPLQQVDAKGLITVPYAGTIQAAGKTTEQVKSDIENKLRNRAIEPQVVVSLADRRSGSVSVLGEVTTPVRFALDPGGSRLLEAVARAGGTKFPVFEMLVTLQRRGRIEQVPLISAVRDPSQNVYLEQGDSIVLSREPRSFIVLGATPPPGSFGGQNNRRFVFESENLTLAEGLAKAGGLLSTQADARAVFIYRQESREVLSRAGVDVSANLSETIPTIYQISLAEADGYFLASELYIRDRDVIYVSDSPIFEAAKFFTIIAPLTNAVGQVGRANVFN
ncbi:polysaccharide biosynthesis/export family protein [Methylobacterium sp. Leaf111]|uniref:polysaccharide biosynthesis/export family protein n=1 Tax=Methylobacterium sp. Leaf111 TaxID=1736257 RepID=UPI00138F17DD|nr:polysaccharide biosynthesis/export family protein [Methylobacterium sp. Leaf111]